MRHTTLAEAKGIVQHALNTGELIACPCCDQTVKLYARQIHKNMWFVLKLLERTGTGLLSRELDKLTSCRDYPKMRFWRLAVQGDDKRWRITNLGRQFLRGEVAVPKYGYFYNAKPYGFSEETVTAHDCESKFDITELLNAPVSIEVRGHA